MPDSLNIDQSKRQKSKVEFVLNNPDEDLSGCTLVTGFYGLGKCGFISVNHMVVNLEAKLIGYVVSEFLPPFISIKNERIVLPFEIYRYEDVVFIATYFEPYKYEQRSFAEAIIKSAKDMHFERVIVIGGLDSRLRVDDEVLAKAVYTRRYKEDFDKPAIPYVDEGLYISGPMALLLMYAEIHNMPAIGILPYAERSRPDPVGASNAVNIVNQMTGLECSVEELIQEAESIESSFEDLDKVIEEEEKERKGSDHGMFM